MNEDVDYWRHRAEQAEADLAALRDAARRHTQGPLVDRPVGWDMLVKLLATDHPGDELTRELIQRQRTIEALNQRITELTREVEAERAARVRAERTIAR